GGGGRPVDLAPPARLPGRRRRRRPRVLPGHGYGRRAQARRRRRLPAGAQPPVPRRALARARRRAGVAWRSGREAGLDRNPRVGGDEVTDGLAADPRPLVSVVVPAYNEALKLMGSLTAVYTYLGTLHDRYRFEILVVDDGSTDETGDIADVFAKTHPGVLVLHHKVNFRLGQALQYAFGQSKGDYVVTFDADLSYSPEHIGRMLDALVEKHARVVVASPYMKGGRTSAIPWRREVMSKGVNKLLSRVSHSRVATVTGMVRAYDGPFI